MADSVTILLVEDNPDDAALTELALRSWPAHLQIARDAGEAVDYLFGNAHGAPRLVLLDLGFRTPAVWRCCGASARTSARG